MEALDQARAPLTQVILASAAATNDTAGKNAGYPLTKPLHNGRVQTGTGVSCMGSKRGSAEFTAVRPLLWPLEFAVRVGVFFAFSVRISVPFSQQNCPLVQSFNQAVRDSAYLHRMDGARQVLRDIACIVFRWLSARQADELPSGATKLSQRWLTSVRAIGMPSVSAPKRTFIRSDAERLKWWHRSNAAKDNRTHCS